jgi:energy-coupling factor transporter ATP-binding protein EcfA2
MSLLPHRATDLATAYKISDVQPLTGEDLDRYYVDLGAARKNDAIININSTLELQEPAQHSAILFTGHRGCGKSTELRLLQRTWQEHFHVIYLEREIGDREGEAVLLQVLSVTYHELGDSEKAIQFSQNSLDISK